MPKLRANTGCTLRPIHASAGVEAWYKAQLEYLLGMMYTQAVFMISDAWKEAPPSIGFAQDSGVRWLEPLSYQSFGGTFVPGQWLIAEDAPRTTTLVNKALRKWGDEWIARFDRLSVGLATKFAEKSHAATQFQMRRQFKKAGFTVAFTPTKGALEAYRVVIDENVGLIRNMPAEFVNQIRGAVWSSVLAGGDLQALKEELAKKHSIANRRASLIARDQNNKAKAVLENVRRQELGIVEAIWQHSAGGKTPRPSHVDASAKRTRYPLAKGWYDKDEGKFIWPGQLINCRCTSWPIIPGLDD